jgi:hypothetical protein
MFLKRTNLLLLLISICVWPALAQQRDQKPDEQKSPKPAKTRGMSKEAEELRLNAISLLHSLAQSANEIDDVSERVRVLAEIGDAFWAVDQEHSRSVLMRSYKEIDKLSASTQADAERIANQKRALRRVVLSRIAKHDPSLTSELVHEQPSEISTANERAMQRQGVSTPNADALLGLAENLLASDTKRAAAIAATSLQDGLSQRFRLFLIRLRAKDTAAADALLGAALTEASAQHPGRLFDVLILWDYAYQPQDFYFNGVVWGRENNEPRSTVTRALRRSILAFGVTAIVENLQQLPASPETVTDQNAARTNLRSLYSVMQQLLPTIQTDWPRGMADLQQALVRVEQELRAGGQPLPGRPPVEDAEANMSAIDRLLEKAGAASQGDARDELYLAAALKLLQMHQYERGKDVAAKIDDADRRANILEPLNFYLAGELVEKEKLQDAVNVANQLKTPELRIGALARIGRAFIDAGDSQSGLQALTTAQSLVSKADPTFELSAAALRVAAAFAKDDPIRTSEAISVAIQILNKVKQDETPWPVMSAAALDDTLSLTWKNGEGGGLKSVKAAYPRNGGLANLLFKLDFNEAITLAKTVNKKTLSIAAQAAVCRAVIESSDSKPVAARTN